MRFVQPIRDKTKIEEMKNELKKTEYGERNVLLFIAGINTGLRISDILKLRVRDVKNKTHIAITEKKTKKYKLFFINDELKKEFNKYIKNMKDDEYLFWSRKGSNKAISRVQAYRIQKKVADKCNINDFGCCSTRKTFAWHYYQKYKSVALLQEIFNHSSERITLRYIGITQDIQDETIKNFHL